MIIAHIKKSSGKVSSILATDGCKNSCVSRCMSVKSIEFDKCWGFCSSCSSIIFKFWTAYLSTQPVSWPCRNVIPALVGSGWYMERFHSYPGYPKRTGWIISWKIRKYHGWWGYPHFSKPSYCFLVIIFSDMVLSAVGVFQMYHCCQIHHSQIHSRSILQPA